MRIAVAGLGYVGLANAILLAQHNEVIAFDIDARRVAMVNAKISPLKDAEIEHFLANEPLMLTATSDAATAIQNAELVVVATPTNYDAEKNFFDTSSVEAVLTQVAEYSAGATVVIKSTVPVGYTERIRAVYPRLQLLFSPEFLREGHALYDNLYPSRIVVGGERTRAERFAKLLADGARKKDIPQLITSYTEAEAIKLFSNTYLALRVAYFNELDSYAQAKGLDTKSIIDGVCLDPRIGDGYNNPSFGYGGYCLPKDTKQLLANYNAVPQNIISAIVEANRTRKNYIADSVRSRQGKTIGIYRLTMKTHSDNFRDSAVLDIMDDLARDHRIIIYEPLLATNSYKGFAVVNDFTDFTAMSDIVLANRYDERLALVREKLYTRDLYDRD